MVEQGRYADGRTYDLPHGWTSLADGVAELAAQQALKALGTRDGLSLDRAVTLVRAYYEPEGTFAGNLFCGAEPHDDLAISPADLWAVSTLGIEVPSLTGRRLLAEGPKRTNVTRQLRRIHFSQSVTDLTPEVLDAMWDLQDCLRTVMSSEQDDSVWWMFAATMCARKRPLLFPVRDPQVSRYLSAEATLDPTKGRLEDFSEALQIFAHLMTSEAVTDGIDDLRAALSQTSVAAEVDPTDLRLLDVALWMTANYDDHR